MTFFSINSNCDLEVDFHYLKPELAQATVILNITVMLYENHLINRIAIAIITRAPLSGATPVGVSCMTKLSIMYLDR